MRSLLILDSGPLFSLAAGGLLNVLLNFRIGVTDMVKEETINRGLAPDASLEAQALLAFYNAHAPAITVLPTQVGQDVQVLRASGLPLPPNLGELSIQSVLIRLQMMGGEPAPVVVFEDGWFLRNAVGLAKPYTLISTQAFLVNAEKLKLIKSAAKARQAIAKSRPYAYADIDVMDSRLSP